MLTKKAWYLLFVKVGVELWKFHSFVIPPLEDNITTVPALFLFLWHFFCYFHDWVCLSSDKVCSWKFKLTVEWSMLSFVIGLSNMTLIFLFEKLLIPTHMIQTENACLVSHLWIPFHLILWFEIRYQVCSLLIIYNLLMADFWKWS